MLKACLRRTQESRNRTALESKQRLEQRYQRLIAFALPLLAFYFAFAAHGLWPFGNRHLLAYDLYHQYAPFLLELKRKILSGDSLFFSWSGGLGVNFYSFFTYYVASPFNLLIVLFPDQNIAEAVTLITLLKIGFSSLFFREFLCGAFRKRDPLASLFGGFYALSAWVFAYSWNIMWLDTLVFFPLACLGLVELIRDGKAKRYVFALTMMLVTNYYTAFFGCVFLLLYYFVLRAQFAPQSKQKLEPLASLGRFAGYSALSGLLSGVVLWPTVRALSITSAAGDAFPTGFSFNQAFLDTLGRLTPLREPNIMSGLPNIFAGILVLLLVPAFFAGTNRPRRVRLAYGLLFGFILFSFQSKTLSFLWHGGHYPNSLDYRYAFVFILLTLTMAYQAIGDELALKRTPILMTLVATFALLLAEQRFQQNDALSHWRLLVLPVFAIGYLMIFFDFRVPDRNRRYKSDADARAPSDFARLTQGVTYSLTERHPSSPRSKIAALGNLTHKSLPPLNPKTRLRRVRHRRALAALFLLLALELLFHAFTSAALYQKIAPLGDRAYYTSNEYATEIYGYTDTLRRDYAGLPWRAEIAPDTCVNDPFLFGSNGMSLFASPFPKAAIEYFSNLGYPVNGVNSFQHKESTIVMDSLLSIDYLMVKESRIFDDRIRKKVAQGKETRLLKNEDALSFGYFVTPE
ncbi:MAG TPA: YfhO family protein, partial [Clostridia bacterium]|nr:YfhO family protein [Clostridia bacterium]